MKVNLEAHAMGKKLGIHRYLVDLTRSRNTESVVDHYQFAYDKMRAEAQMDAFARVALLVSPDDHSHDFFATVSGNAGLNVFLFRDQETALRHLLKE